MNLTIKSPSDLALYFEHEPAPWWGERKTYLDERQVIERVVHASEVPLDALFSLPAYDGEEIESFDINQFALFH